MLLLLPIEMVAQSALYKRYASKPELTVAQINGFKLNDSTQIDVVMVKCDNIGSWRKLMATFGIDDSTGATSWLGKIDRPERHTRWNGRPVMRVVVSHEHRTVGFYRIDNSAQYDAIVEYQTRNMSPRHK